MTEDDSLLTIENVRKNFDGLVALEDVNLSVYEDEILGLIGPNGAGKSTLMNLISGVFPVTDGHIYLRDDDLTNLAKHEIVNRGVVRTFQEARHFEQFTGRENIQVADTEGTLLSRDIFFSALLPEKGKSDIMDVAIEEIGLTDEELEKTPENMSHLELVKLAIARAVVNDPQLLLLDEPFAGLTSEEADMLVDVISRLNEREITIVVIDHNIQKVSEVVERMAVLHQGEIIIEGDPELVVEDERTQDAYFGT